MDLKLAAFLEKVRPAAQAVEAAAGIPWLFAATQAAHESGCGLSKLTVDANNLFGLTGDTWSVEGKPVYWIVTQEYAKDGTPFRIRRPFRKYTSWQESLNDWAGLIERRYPAALAGARANDFPAFAGGLQAGGYATDPRYTVQLVGLYAQISAEGIA